MKLQRYEIIRRTGDAWKLVENDAGAWCKSEDVVTLEAENESLRSEIDRLKGSPKELSAEEVAEPGGYWFRVLGEHQWIWTEVFFDEDGTLCFSDGAEFMRRIPRGQFIGPLTPPEV